MKSASKKSFFAPATTFQSAVRFPYALAFGFVILGSLSETANGGTTHTWDGRGANVNWTTAGNWNLNVAPTPPGFENDTDIFIFTGNTLTANTNNFAADSNIAITFGAGASSFTLGGNSIDLFTPSGAITNNGPNTQTINLNVRARGTASSINNNGGLLNLATISGATVNTSGNDTAGTHSRQVKS